jgi:hypothetical protein
MLNGSCCFLLGERERRAVDVEKTECGVGGRPVRALSINERLCVTAGDAGPAATAAVDPYLDKALSFSSPNAKRTNVSMPCVGELNNFPACFLLCA